MVNMRGKLNLRKPRELSSACPRCYREGTALAFHHGTDTLPFECECGHRWLTTGKAAKSHAWWLDNKNRNLSAKPWGD